MTIAEHVPLQDLTTFKIGGNARFFITVSTIEELKEALNFAHIHKLSLFVLGGGSNVLISDNGFDGLVIKIEIKGIKLNTIDSDHTELIAGAGEEWDYVVNCAVEHDLYGIENLSLIPGSVGAAPVQNIGAYGSEVKDTILWVEVLNSDTNEIRLFSNKECQFGYRDSYFKKAEGKKYIITRVAFLLSKKSLLNTSYKDISEYVKKNNIHEITLKKVREIVIAIRTEKLPNTKEIGTAGSFFKNPLIATTEFELLQKKYPEIVGYKNDSGMTKVSAAWVLDILCGFKGYREGNSGVYKNQALVLVNFGGATSNDIISLADKMIFSVKEKTNIILEKEVQIIK